ncbi:MAG: M23 family metallopeptidase, partial [Phycisphaerae bacterium]|nr:M23 family metallopeptidase [Phycisphaerae bacterium]
MRVARRPSRPDLVPAALLAALLICCTPPAAVNNPADPAPADATDLYYLPYETGRASIVLQGHFGPFSHEQSYALDFQMPRGTPILAARRGIVSAVRDDCPDCSCVWDSDCACCGFANRVEITHADGSRAIYAHLDPGGVLVAVGQPVEARDMIGLSGSTGYSAAPHLHFEVRAPLGPALPAEATGRFGPSSDGTLEVRFEDVAGDGVPRML